MTISLAQLDTDLGNLIADMPVTATWTAVEFTVNRTNRMQTKENRSQDVISKYQFTLIFQVSDFTAASLTAPTAGKLITYAGRDYRVLDTDESPELLELRCNMGAEYARGR